MLLTACGGSGGGAKTSTTTFCDAARTAKNAADVQQKLFDATETPTPEQVRPAVEDFAAKFAAMNASAPAEIRHDVLILDAAAQQLLTIVRTNGFDVTKMISTPEFASLNDVFSSSDYQDAQNRFQTYLDTTCGLTGTTSPETTPGTTPVAGT